MLGVTVFGASWFWYYRVASICPIPLAYSIGTIDSRFAITDEQVQAVMAEAAAVWEIGTGRDLFVYDPAAPFTINFIFDDRQELTLEEHQLQDVLDRKEEISSSIREEYENLLTKYQRLKQMYETRVKTYENNLATHNGEVAYWNNQGGATKELYDRLNAEQEALNKESTALGTLAQSLNRLVDSINKLGEQGNETVQDYNNEVVAYNNRFYHAREFTQGDYYQGRINIYQFKDMDELRLVLTHELGHALSLDHVAGTDSVMYYLMSERNAPTVLSAADIVEFSRVCGVRAGGTPWYTALYSYL